ncbi:hypothetical protein ACWIUD_00510 [Helicobacter sp. 23-1044]
MRVGRFCEILLDSANRRICLFFTHKILRFCRICARFVIARRGKATTKQSIDLNIDCHEVALKRAKSHNDEERVDCFVALASLRASCNDGLFFILPTPCATLAQGRGRIQRNALQGRGRSFEIFRFAQSVGFTKRNFVLRA